MLVNVSRFKNVQRQVFDLLDERGQRGCNNAIELHHGDRTRPTPRSPNSATCFDEQYAAIGVHVGQR